jgi:hypothetical protein
MPDDLGSLVGQGRRAVGAILFIGAATNTYDVYSAVNSSPWTAESFGGDPKKAASCRNYVRHAVGISSAYGLAASLIARSWWPVIGTLAANGYMFWMYERALGRAADSGSTSWGS